MSFRFDDAVGQYLDYGDIRMFDGRVGQPLCGHAWVKLDTNSNDNTIFSKFNGGTSHGFVLYNDRTSSTSSKTKIFRAFIDDGGSGSLYPETATDSATTGVWHSVGFRSWGSTSARVHLNGSYSGTDFDSAQAGNISTPSAAPFRIGAIYSGASFNMDGYVSDVALWARELSLTEWKMLADGYRAANFPSRRIFYDPLNSPELYNRDGDGIGTNVNGATFSFDEPPFKPIVHRASSAAFKAQAAAGGGLSIPVAMQNYRRQRQA